MPACQMSNTSKHDIRNPAYLHGDRPKRSFVSEALTNTYIGSSFKASSACTLSAKPTAIEAEQFKGCVVPRRWPSTDPPTGSRLRDGPERRATETPGLPIASGRSMRRTPHAASSLRFGSSSTQQIVCSNSRPFIGLWITVTAPISWACNSVSKRVSPVM